MVIYALVLRKFIFCPSALPFTASHLSVWGSCVGVLKLWVGPLYRHRPNWSKHVFVADLMHLFSRHKKLQVFEYFVLFIT